MLEIEKGIFAINKCIYLAEHKVLVIADIHLGYEEHLSRKGTLIPKFQYSDIVNDIEWALGQADVKTAVLNGDIKHEFGTVSRQEWRDATKLVKFFREKNIEVIAVRGNHDTIFGPVARKLEVEEVKEKSFGNVLIAHGDYVPAKLEPILIIGHAHPAVTLRDEAKAEKFKCFAKMKYRKSTVICQPSFNPLTVGHDIEHEKLLSPLMMNIDKAEIYIVDEKNKQVLRFGFVKDL